jgi:eukaryotic-like serine/threonine-protein kinase
MASETDDSKQKTASGLRVLSPEARASAAPGSAQPAPASVPLSTRYGAGDVIADKYRLGRRLGEGGMGEVWFAHNETLDIDVAIKLIRGDVANPEMAERLLNEARAAARLGHPAIVRVNDFGKTNRGDPFIVMELLDGEDLASALVKRGRLSATKAVRTLLPIAHALTVAHTKGIIHRDLKPENIFLAKTDDGKIQPKLVDFGVAKLEKQQANRVTQGGALLGSPLYMSPEQARGDDVDHRADIWAFAVVLYEAITGRAPFEGKNYNAVLYSIVANAPTPLTELELGDAELWSLLDRAFQKDPDRRWYSVRDFGEALARWLDDHDVHEDITGASLKTSWLSWKKDEDALAAGPSNRPPPDDAPGALPPVPHPAASIAEEARAREITIRKPKQDNRSLYLIAGIGAAALIVGVLAVLLSRSSSEAPTVSQPMLQQPANPAAVAQPAAAPQDPDDPAHEKAVEEALAAANAAPPAPAPSAPAPHASVEHAERPHQPAQAAPARTTISASKGIYTADPYRGSGSSKLKNPFQ